jgi:chromosome segregation ATPase
MSKNNPKKAARQRRRSRQKQLVEAGRQAEDLVSTYKQQAAEAVALAGRLEAEVAKARQDLGEATSLLADTNKALNANATILDGLRAELDIAAQQVRMTEAERDAMAADLSKFKKELEIARAADIDTKSLRARLQHKSEEIEDLKARLRDAVAALRRATSVHGFDHTKREEAQVENREEGTGGRGVVDVPNASPGNLSE